MPDTFKDGAEVVLTGQLIAGGFEVEPDGVIGEVPVEVRSQGQKARPARPPVEMAIPRHLPDSRGVRRLRSGAFAASLAGARRADAR